MNQGQYIFSQLVDFLDRKRLNYLTCKYKISRGDIFEKTNLNDVKGPNYPLIDGMLD